MTGMNSERKAKLSVVGLMASASAAILGICYLIDLFFIGGSISMGIAETCRSVISSCEGAASKLFTWSPDARHFMLALGIGALSFAVLKAAGVLFFARRIKSLEGRQCEPPERVRAAISALGASELTLRFIDSDVPIAYTDGFFKPSIHLSRGLASALDDAQLRGVLAHEYAHVKRRDNLAIFLALAVRDFLFVFPLSHLLFGVFMREKEHAADDLAVELTGDPVGLAEAIVKVARLKSSGRKPAPAYASFFPNRALVRERVTRLVGCDVPRRVGIAKVITATVVSLALLGAMVGIATAQSPTAAATGKECKSSQSCERQNSACCLR